jgi:hypothetical protein
MQVKTLRVSLLDSEDRLRDSFARRDEGQREKPLGSRMREVNALRERQRNDKQQVEFPISSHRGANHAAAIQKHE